jgi:Uma2 family endonuclease
MANAAITPFLTVEEYFNLDSRNERPSEYKNGLMVPIEAATEPHGAIVGNLIYLIGDALRKRDSKCSVYTQCMRVYTPDEGVYAYPDIVLACEDSRYGPESTLLNPVFIIEVLSPTTEAYDRGMKFQHYRSIPRFGEYVMIAQDRISIEHHRLDSASGKWMLYADLRDLSGSLEVLSDSLPVGEIYRRVSF